MHWHGTGIYRCGICTPPGTKTDCPVTREVTLGGRTPRYRCTAANHLTRNAGDVDRLVFAHVAYAVTHPRAYMPLARYPLPIRRTRPTLTPATPLVWTLKSTATRSAWVRAANVTCHTELKEIRRG
jgi:hypothetical protein